MNIIKEHICTIKGCRCGWNIKIGGNKEEELQELKNFVENRKEITNKAYHKGYYEGTEVFVKAHWFNLFKLSIRKLFKINDTL